MDKYPYFISPLLTELKQASAPKEIEKIKMSIAANIGNREVLERLIGNNLLDIDDFYPQKAAEEMTTETTINTFIEKFSKPRKKKQAATDTVPENEAPSDYFRYMAEEENSPAPTPRAPHTPDRKPARQYTMEDVKNLVKNGEYERALEIMNMFYLNNPKKSVYFADQIRFIKKMMVNEELKRKKENL